MLWIIIGILLKSNARLNLVSSVEKQKNNYIFDVVILTLKKRRTYQTRQSRRRRRRTACTTKTGRSCCSCCRKDSRSNGRSKPAAERSRRAGRSRDNTKCCPKKDSTQTTGSPGSKTSKSRCDVRFRIHRGQFIFSSFTCIG
ncbi:Hypothetical_protein [Hexamita inflata]|uniref:Hypothetical_protein n=1 Tax=Hexamita inflata TaxID=28002 RepID=A0AA86USC0_9EUKA|nr:Hypothetical protein HINF_LOCUS50431 [Hexamita inflata]